MTPQQLLQYIAIEFVSRVRALEMPKGKKREDAAFNFFLGAITATTDPTTKEYLIRNVVLVLSSRGYKAVEEWATTEIKEEKEEVTQPSHLQQQKRP